MNNKKGTKKITLEGWDGSTATVKVNSEIKSWKRGKCWVSWCSNYLFYFKVSKNGIAQHGYCAHIRPEEFGKRFCYRKGQKICHIEKGKIVVDYEHGRKRK